MFYKHPKSEEGRAEAERFMEACREERGVGEWRVEEKMEWFTPARVHARLAEGATGAAVRHLHTCLGQAHAAAGGVERDAGALAAAVAQAERLTREEEESRRLAHLAQHSMVYGDEERRRVEALQFWFNINETRETKAWMEATRAAALQAVRGEGVAA